MKKTKLCAVGLAATMLLSTSALAATDLQKQDADLLNELGLLKGTGSGYALDRTLTRVEGGVMLVRLLGGEQEALAKNYACPFTDVADWAKPYVGWLYHEKLTNGTSATTYVPNRQMTMKEYLWFLGRASGYTDEEIADGKGVVSKASYDAQKDTKINRGQMSALSIDTLYHEVSGGKETLADQLITDQVFTQDQWDKVRRDLETAKMEANAKANYKGSTWTSAWVDGADSKGPTYGGYRIYRWVNGKVVAQSGILGEAYLDYTKYGVVFLRRQSEFYVLDPMTLKETKLFDVEFWHHDNYHEYKVNILGRQGNTFLFLDVGSEKMYTWSEDEGVKSVEVVDMDAVSDVSPQFVTTPRDHRLLAFEASGKVKSIYTNSKNPNGVGYCDIQIKGNACYFIPRVSDTSITDDEFWKNIIVYGGGLQVLGYENNQVKTLLSLPENSGMRLDKITDIQGDTVTTNTSMIALQYFDDDEPADAGDFKIQGNAQHAKFIEVGFSTYNNELFSENPSKPTKQELLDYWNKQVFGSENP